MTLSTQTFDANYDQIRPIVQFINAGAEAAGFDAKTRFQIELACDEASNNIIEHAYGAEGQGQIVVSHQQTNGTFHITLHDTGTPFAPQMIDPPATIGADTPIDDVAIGGLGMHMMRRVMDEVDYQFDDNGNTVTMVKWLPASGVVWQRKLLNGLDVVSIMNRLDADTNPTVEAALKGLTSAEKPQLIIDLSQSPYVNSGGLRVLVSAWRSAHQKQGEVVLLGLHGELIDIFSMVGFDKIFRLYDSFEDAVGHFEMA